MEQPRESEQDPDRASAARRRAGRSARIGEWRDHGAAESGSGGERGAARHDPSRRRCAASGVRPPRDALLAPKPPPEAAAIAATAAAPRSEPPPKAPAAAAPDIDDDEKIDWVWPAKGKVVVGFSETANLKGIDIAGASGEPVIASAGGKVVYVGNGLRGYGKLVIVKHNKTWLSAYAHNREILVKEGQQVTKGQKIAEMGNTDADTVKLHFEIRRLGKPVDPARYLPAG